jgi:hypothetical protein
MPKIVIDRQELRRFLSNPQAVANFETMMRAVNNMAAPVESLPPAATDLASRAVLLARTG